MEKLGIVLVLIAFLLLPAVVYADGFSSIIDDGRVEITLSYPVEVKTGTCFTLVFQTTFLETVTVDTLKLTVTYISQEGSTILLSDTLVGTLTTFNEGQILKTYVVCVPPFPRIDPLITATVYANYTRDVTFQQLTHYWTIAVVRNRTYNELQAALANAENLIAYLRSTIEDLQNQVNVLKARLEEALRESARLSTSLEEARRELERFDARYRKLYEEYRALNEKYIDTVSELRSLESLYQSLIRENAALSENYRILLSDYRNLTSEFTALQASYTQLQSLFDNLSDRHEAAKQQIGYLQSQLDETRAMLQDLQLRYNVLSGENTLHRNLAYIQAFALVGVVAGIASIVASRRLRKAAPGFQPPAQPQLPPPPGEEKTQEHEGEHPR